MEKIEALTTKIDSQLNEMKGEMKEIRDGYTKSGGPHLPSKYDDKLKEGSKEENDSLTNPNDKITVTYDDSDDEDENKAEEDNLTPSVPKKTKPILMKVINVPVVDVLAGMPNYNKFLKELVSKKNKLEEIFAAFLNEECSAIIQNKIPPKLRVCTLGNAITCNALADLGVAENMLVQVGQFIFPMDFIILEMEDSKELNLRVGNERITFMINKAMQHSHSNDDTCFNIDVIDEVTKEEIDALLNDSDPFMSTSKNLNETNLDREFSEFMEVKFEEADEKEGLVFVLKNHKAFAWKTSDIPDISYDFCKHKINFEDNVKPVIQRQCRLNPNIKEVVKKEMIKLLNSGIIYPIEDSP
ncbi:hypothetical protein Tco_0670249 [Tanacetum coccineum]